MPLSVNHQGSDKKRTQKLLRASIAKPGVRRTGMVRTEGGGIRIRNAGPSRFGVHRPGREDPIARKGYQERKANNA